jgi:hypothetical protein
MSSGDNGASMGSVGLSIAPMMMPTISTIKPIAASCMFELYGKWLKAKWENADEPVLMMTGIPLLSKEGRLREAPGWRGA